MVADAAAGCGGRGDRYLCVAVALVVVVKFYLWYKYLVPGKRFMR